MASHTFDLTSIVSATGWTNATAANLTTSNDVRATGGTAGELILAEVTNTPADFGSPNTVVLSAEWQISGSATRAKSLLIELVNAAGTVVFATFTTPTQSSAAGDVSHSSTALDISARTQAELDGARLRCTVQESGGMGDSVTVSIDRLWATMDYELAAVTHEGSISGGVEAGETFQASLIEAVLEGAFQAGVISAEEYAARMTLRGRLTGKRFTADMTTLTADSTLLTADVTEEGVLARAGADWAASLNLVTSLTARAVAGDAFAAQVLTILAATVSAKAIADGSFQAAINLAAQVMATVEAGAEFDGTATLRSDLDADAILSGDFTAVLLGALSAAISAGVVANEDMEAVLTLAVQVAAQAKAGAEFDASILGTLQGILAARADMAEEFDAFMSLVGAGISAAVRVGDSESAILRMAASMSAGAVASETVEAAIRLVGAIQATARAAASFDPLATFRPALSASGLASALFSAAFVGGASKAPPFRTLKATRRGNRPAVSPLGPAPSPAGKSVIVIPSNPRTI